METQQGAADKPLTAMEIVRQAQRNEIDHETLVATLQGWPFRPQYRTVSEIDDWEVVEDSLDAVLHAYIALDLLSEAEYDTICTIAASRGS